MTTREWLLVPVASNSLAAAIAWIRAERAHRRIDRMEQARRDAAVPRFLRRPK